MSVRERLEHLRQLAHDPASEATWAAILTAVEDGPSQLVDYIAPHLDRWPDALRFHPGVPERLPPWWPLIRTLSLRETSLPTPDAVAATLAQAVVRQITRLDLSLCGLNTPEKIRAAASALPDGLSSLDLSANALAGDTVTALGRAPGPAALAELHLGGTGLDAAEIGRLVTWDPLERLRTLDVSGCTLRGAAVRRLATARPLRHLDRLGASRTGLRDGALTSLCDGRTLARLTRLDLHDNEIFGESLAALARVAGGTLEALDLSGNPAVVLDDVAGLHSLRALRLSTCGLDKRRAATLGQCVMPSLRSLDLSDNPLADAGCTALAGGPVLAMVDDLDLSGCALRGLRLPALLRHASLTSLNLADNTLRSAAVRHLADWAGFAALRRLDVRDNLLRDNDAGTLAGAMSGALTHLAVSSHYLEDSGAQALVRAAQTGNLTALWIGGRISPATLAALLETTSAELTELVMEEDDTTPIHDWGPAAVALSRSASFPALQRASLPRFAVDTGVALLRGPRAGVRAILRGCAVGWLRALAIRMAVPVRRHCTANELAERLLTAA